MMVVKNGRRAIIDRAGILGIAPFGHRMWPQSSQKTGVDHISEK